MIAFALVLAMRVAPAVPQRAAALVAEARAVGRIAGEQVWPGFSQTPFPVLLVGAQREYLFCPVGPAKGFRLIGRDRQTGCMVKVRRRKHIPAIRVTYAAVDDAPTVVIGLPAQVEGNEAAWIATLLHEHFHQMQMHASEYQAGVRALAPPGQNGDSAWMMRFAFPYGDAGVDAAFARLAHSLALALGADGQPAFLQRVARWRRARRAAFAHLGAAATRYGEFQLWQEGVARYSEIALAGAAAGHVVRRGARHDYAALALNLRARVLHNLAHFDMAANGRVSFYALGAGEALLLDRLTPRWRAQYFHTGLSMAPLVYRGVRVHQAFSGAPERQGHGGFSASERGGAPAR